MRLSEFSSDAVLTDEGVKELFEKIYSLLHLSLADMKRLSLETEGHHDFTHNLSYDSAVFPYLHGLILGSSLGLWFGVEGKEVDISASADGILQLDINIHPCIRRALQILKLAEKGRENTIHLIIQNCFLLPSSVASLHQNKRADDAKDT